LQIANCKLLQIANWAYGVEGETLSSQEQLVYEELERLGISFIRHEHPPVATVEEANQHWAGIDAMHFKNLFLRNPKGDRHYLVVVQSVKRVDLKSLAAQIADGRLSFGSPERLMKHLGLTPGSVSPFGLINDRDHSVRVMLDRDVKTAARVAFHPNINTATLTVATADFLRFLATCGNPVQYVAI
jgi:Ala-tRNA(Pro) deacylase